MSEREKQIFNLLSERGDLSIQELSTALGISNSSVRRELLKMRQHRFIHRTRGGATLLNAVNYSPLPIHKPPVAIKEARAIAHQAVQLIERGDVIGLSGGRICSELALHMRMLEGITVVTNAINVAAELVALPGIQLMLTGGNVDPRSFELTGKATMAGLDGIRIHKYFVGTDGITVEHGMSNHSEAVALVAREFTKHSDQTIVLADSSKFQRSNLSKVVDISEIAIMITTNCTPPEIVRHFQEAGITVHCCSIQTQYPNAETE